MPELAAKAFASCLRSGDTGTNPFLDQFPFKLCDASLLISTET